MNKNKKPFTGLHILGEITTNKVEKLKSLYQVKKLLIVLLKNIIYIN